ncbi:MAG: cytochrome c [Anaerolineae bacterium]|nr:cytochrome c [Anaerolineae bacterium]
MKKIIRWIGIGAGGLLALLVLVAIGLSWRGNVRLNRIYNITPEAVILPTDAADIQEGERLVAIYCTNCHGDGVSGTDFFNDPTLAVIDAPNLTSGEGGVGAQLSDVDWVRAIRHGVDPAGRPLFIMPSRNFYLLSDEDLGEIIAYLKTAPPVDHSANDRSTTFLGRTLLTLGLFGDLIDAERINHTAPRPAVPTPGVTVEYGQYLAVTFGCQTCHGPQLAGGKDPDPEAPPGPNLTPGGKLGAWDEHTFINTIRTRKSKWMAFEALNHMTDTELQALWRYLQSLPAVTADQVQE